MTPLAAILDNISGEMNSAKAGPPSSESHQGLAMFAMEMSKRGRKQGCRRNNLFGEIQPLWLVEFMVKWCFSW